MIHDASIESEHKDPVIGGGMNLEARRGIDACCGYLLLLLLGWTHISEVLKVNVQAAGEA